MEATSNNLFTNKYPIGYALSGGFIKGFAHLGVMQSLLEHDIKPNILSGVSAGALAGVFYADANEQHKVLDYFSGHKFQDLTKLVIPKVGLFELGEFIDFLKTNLKAKTMEELQIPHHLHNAFLLFLQERRGQAYSRKLPHVRQYSLCGNAPHVRDQGRLQ